MDTREAATAEFLDELAAIEKRRDALSAEFRDRARLTIDFGAQQQFRSTAELHHAVALRCEQVRGEITDALMFDRIDAETTENAEKGA